MNLKRLLPWGFSLGLMLLASCGLAGTNNPGVIFVPGQVPFDASTLAFLSRAGISTHTTEGKAVGRLVYDLKQANIWTNLYAFYPFVGSSSNSTAQNLVSTNWCVTWSGTNYFRQSGVTGDGISGYGDTGFYQTNLVGALTNNLHVYAYFNAHSAGGGLIFGSLQQHVSTTSGSIIFAQNPGGAGALVPTSAATGPGQVDNGGLTFGHMFVQRSDATHTSWSYGIPANQANEFYSTSSSASASFCPTNTFLILGTPNPKDSLAFEGFSSNTICSASFGLSLSQQEITNYIAIINRFETALHRNNP